MTLGSLNRRLERVEERLERHHGNRGNAGGYDGSLHDWTDEQLVEAIDWHLARAATFEEVLEADPGMTAGDRRRFDERWRRLHGLPSDADPEGRP